jgi:hypothetical protein
MSEVFRVYPWKARLKPLAGTSIIMWLLLRPSYWPWSEMGDADRVFVEQYLNRLVCAALIVLTIAGIDLVLTRVLLERSKATDSARRADEVRALLPHPFWVGLVATLVLKTVVDFGFAARPMPPGRDGLYWFERWFDVVALAGAVALFFVSRRIGPPSTWPGVRSLVLDPPTAD